MHHRAAHVEGVSVRPWVLLDCDGVLLDWESGLEHHMRTHHAHVWTGYKNDHAYDLARRYNMDAPQADHIIKDFHTHAAYAHLQPLPGATTAIKHLHKFCDLAVITASGTHELTQRMRRDNLAHMFGDVFEHVHCTDTFDEKRSYLAQYPSGYWVEDHAHNALMGVELGHDAYLIHAAYNQMDHTPHVTRVHNMLQAAELILESLRAKHLI
jgi:FMN phosphatase YigB (HAD superfamily)